MGALQQIFLANIQSGSNVNARWSGITHYYKCDNNFLDSVGSTNGNNNGGVGFRTGIINQAYSFDGVNDYLNFGVDAFKMTGSFTISLWFNADGITGTLGLISTLTPAPFLGWVLYQSSASLIWVHERGPGLYSQIFVTSAITTGVNHHVVITHDPAIGTSVYYDGAFMTSIGATSIAYGAVQSYIGTFDPSIGANFDGGIDEVSLFDGVAKDSTWVTGVYNAGVGVQYPN